MPASNECEDLDPRIRRTREMLTKSLSSLMEEKEYDRISISEITERATLSRATFYDHYEDKDGLLEQVVAGRFQALVAQRGLCFSDCDEALRALVLGVCDYLSEAALALRESEKPLETAIVAVIKGILLEGFARHALPSDLPTTLVASVLAWAIYGGAREWVRTPDRMSAADAAAFLHRMVTPIMASFG